jgi:hypothetical protein
VSQHGAGDPFDTPASQGGAGAAVTATGTAEMRDTERRMAETAAASKAQMSEIEANYAKGEVASRAGRRKVVKFLTKCRSFRFTGRLLPRRAPEAAPDEQPSDAEAPASER